VTGPVILRRDVLPPRGVRARAIIAED